MHRLDEATPHGLQQKVILVLSSFICFITFSVQVFVIVGLYFGVRGKQNMRDLRTDSFIERLDEDGDLYVTLKAKHGFTGHMHAQPGPHCPVVLLRKYLSLLNPNCNAFFQMPSKRPSVDGWYCDLPVGKEKLQTMLSNICKTVGLSKVCVNRSLLRARTQALAALEVKGQTSLRKNSHLLHTLYAPAEVV
jgi:hypothetical protein